jgi:hypothetical protein
VGAARRCTCGAAGVSGQRWTCSSRRKGSRWGDAGPSGAMQKGGDVGASRRSAGVARQSAAAVVEGMRRWPRREILRRDVAAAPRPVARCRRDAGAERVGCGPRVNGNN